MTRISKAAKSRLAEEAQRRGTSEAAVVRLAIYKELGLYSENKET
jgi:hypothetical protein